MKPQEILERKIRLRIESKDGYSALIEALNRRDVRRAFINYLQRHVRRKTP